MVFSPAISTPTVIAHTFGHAHHGKVIRPRPDEFRAITEPHAEKMIDLLDSCDDGAFRSVLKQYAEDFGDRAAIAGDAFPGSANPKPASRKNSSSSEGIVQPKL
jgi:hypothetical protein